MCYLAGDERRIRAAPDLRGIWERPIHRPLGSFHYRRQQWRPLERQDRGQKKYSAVDVHSAFAATLCPLGKSFASCTALRRVSVLPPSPKIPFASPVSLDAIFVGELCWTSRSAGFSRRQETLSSVDSER
jgi:hypothetical protein